MELEINAPQPKVKRTPAVKKSTPTPPPAPKRKKTMPIIWSVLITAIVVGGGIYAWQQMVMNQKVNDTKDRYISELDATRLQLQNAGKVDQPMQLDSEYQTYKDDVLGLSFEYPKGWGVIKGDLREAVGNSDAQRGDFYHLSFSSFASSSEPKIIAGGESKDYLMGRGGSPLDFNGFSSNSYNDLCNTASGTVCTTVKTQVVTKIDMPQSANSCPLDQGLLNLPKQYAMINLPDNSHINGLIIIHDFLSADMKAELYSILSNGGNISSVEDLQSDENFIKNCLGSKPNKNIIKTYKDKLQEILAKIQSNQVDAETQKNLEQFDHFVKSIQFNTEVK